MSDKSEIKKGHAGRLQTLLTRTPFSALQDMVLSRLKPMKPKYRFLTAVL